jgi:serpin B
MVMGARALFALLLGMSLALAVPVPAKADAAAASRAANAANGFGRDVFARLRQQQDKTVLVSPLNAATALAQLQSGARGDTRTDLQSLLHWNAADGSLSAAMHALDGALPRDSGVSLETASAMWLSQRLSLRPEFVDHQRTYFDSIAAHLDFGNPVAAAATINAWISAHTHGNIRHAVQNLSSATRLTLVSALYFKGHWKHHFDASATKPGTFHVARGHAIDAPFMHRTARMDYLDRGNYQAVLLPFADDRYDCIVVLPASEAADAPATDFVGADSAIYDRGAYGERKVQLSLPRLHLEWRGDLRDTLRAMGHGLPFGERADYGGISDQGLVVSSLIHDVTLDLDESGATAAAATVTGMVTAVARPPQQPVVLRVDRPFYVVLRERDSGAIVLVGRVADPGTRAKSQG